MTEILLADFQYLTQAGFAALVGELRDYRIAGILGKAEKLAEAVADRGAGFVVADIDQGKGVQLNDLAELMKGGTKVLVLTNNQDRDNIQQILNVGIRGIVTKNCSREEIIHALHAVSAGNRFFCNRILELVMTDKIEKEVEINPGELTPREVEVIKLVAKGMTTNNISLKLHVSVHTINSHRKNILRKLRLSSPTELIIYAIENGLVED